MKPCRGAWWVLPGVSLRDDRPAMKLHRYAVKSGNVHAFGVKGEYSHDAVKGDFICRKGRGTMWRKGEEIGGESVVVVADQRLRDAAHRSTLWQPKPARFTGEESSTTLARVRCKIRRSAEPGRHA